MSRRSLSRHDYTVGWVCALPKERVAATAMLDERFADLPNLPDDENAYTLGSMCGHNVVIVCLPLGELGTSPASAVAMSMIHAFPSIKFGLMVGIGGGVPPCVRLGDIVVSTPVYEYPGVVQWDLGIAQQETGFRRIGSLNNPPVLLQTALTKLMTEHEMEGSSIPRLLDELKVKWPKLAPKYLRSNDLEDVLFVPDYLHVQSITTASGDTTKSACHACEITRSVKREPRGMEIHYGLIASGNQVIKDGILRNKVNERLGGNVLCFEMEAAGLMNRFPCIVIRGICDYCDSHKNYLWQEHAAAVGAAFAKELLSYTAVEKTINAPNALELLQGIHSKVSDLNDRMLVESAHDRTRKVKKLLKTLYTCPYSERKDRNRIRVEGTCLWFTGHPLFRRWLETQSSLLWVSADPGCGKSVLARYLIDEVLTDGTGMNANRTICYFFFKDDFADQKNAVNALCTILRQLFQQHKHLIEDDILDRFDTGGEKLLDSFPGLWDILLSFTTLIGKSGGEVACVLDALDECQFDDRVQLIKTMSLFTMAASKKPNLKFLVTSCPYDDISRHFQILKSQVPTIHLRGESEEEIVKISGEINLFNKARVREIADQRLLDADDQAFLREQLAGVPNRTYLWVHLVLNVIENMPGFTRGNVRRAIKNIPKTVDDSYERILKRSSDPQKARTLLQILIVAVRPLSLAEMSLVLALDPRVESDDLEEELEPESRFELTVRSICGLFVIIIDSKLYLLHQTAKEFLLNDRLRLEPERFAVQLSFKGRYTGTGEGSTSQPVTIPDANLWKHSIRSIQSNKLFLEICLVYLRSLDTQNWPRALLDYSALYWAFHFRSAGIQLGEKQVVASAQRLCRADFKDSSAWWNLYQQHHPLHYPKTSEALVVAAHLGLDAVVQYLLGCSVNVEAKDARYGQTSLSLASQNGHKQIVALLIDHGAIIDAADDNGWMPLAHAVKQEHEEIVKLLIHNGADPNSLDENGSSILYRSVTSTNLTITKFLLENGADIVPPKLVEEELSAMKAMDWLYSGNDYHQERDDSEARVMEDPLYTAADGGDKLMAALLLDKGANIESKGVSPCPTALIAASQNNNVSMMKLLLTRGANIEARTEWNDSALTCALNHGCRDAVTLLLEHGAKLAGDDQYEQRLLQSAAHGGVISVLEKMLQRGIDPNMRQGSPLYWAIERGHTEAVKLLVQYGANVEQKDESGKTPLIYASDRKDTKMIEVLLEWKADINGSYDAPTVLHHAVARSLFALAEFLLQKGADVDFRYEDGRSILSEMVSNHSGDPRKGVIWLLENGADINSKDKEGMPPAWWALLWGMESRASSA